MVAMVIRVIHILAGSILGAFAGMFYAYMFVHHLIDMRLNLGQWPFVLATVVPIGVGFLLGGWLEFKRSARP